MPKVDVFNHIEKCRRKFIKRHNSKVQLKLISTIILTDNDTTHLTCGQNHISSVIDRHVLYAHGDNKLGQSIHIEC